MPLHACVIQMFSFPLQRTGMFPSKFNKNHMHHFDAEAGAFPISKKNLWWGNWCEGEAHFQFTGERWRSS
jgi:hypothetical protein